MNILHRDDRQRIVVLHFRRFETKFVVSPEQRHAISRYLQLHMERDPFAGKSGVYKVNSLYFDSPGFKFYRDNEAGLKCREKIRYRHYNDDVQDLFWEVKHKIDNVVIKDRCVASIPDGNIAAYISGRMKLFRLRPVVWVHYCREPWIGGRDLRVTFDQHLEAANARGRNDHSLLVKTIPLLPGWEVMELKYSGRLPQWLYRLIGQFNLQRQAFSKYRLAVEKLGMV